jgi:hypothetical protein
LNFLPLRNCALKQKEFLILAGLLCPQAEKSSFVETKHGYSTVFNHGFHGFIRRKEGLTKRRGR